MNKVQVSVSSFVRRGTWRLWGGDWDLCAFYTSQPTSLFSIHPPPTLQESLPCREQTQIENGWSTPPPRFDCIFALRCTTLCCVVFLLRESRLSPHCKEQGCKSGEALECKLLWNINGQSNGLDFLRWQRKVLVRCVSFQKQEPLEQKHKNTSCCPNSFLTISQRPQLFS